MQNPIREQIRLDGRWQARQIDGTSVSVFVPGSWTEKNVLLKPADDSSATESETDPGVEPGQWNTIEVAGGLAGTKLQACNELHITALEATNAGRGCLSVRIRLTGTVADPCLLSLAFSLTAADGRRVGGMDLVVGHKTRDLSVEMPLDASLTGPCRLKAVLCCGDQVVDNARTDVVL